MITAAGIILLLLGATISGMNWYSIYASKKKKRFISAIPLFGAGLLAGGLLCFEATQPYAWIGIFLDYGTLILIPGIPIILFEYFKVSRLNLIHHLRFTDSGRKFDIRLFKRGIFTIEFYFNPPVKAGDSGESIVSGGLQGKWAESEAGYLLTDFDGDRAIEIQKSGMRFIIKENAYPSDRKYPYDNFDKLEFRKVK